MLPLLLSLTLPAAQADTPPAPIESQAPFDLVSAYDAVRAALSDDALPAAQAAARTLATRDATDTEVAGAASRVAAAADLASARAAFSDLSRLTLLRVAALPSAPKVTVYFCPMYKGFAWWIQAKPPIANPYYGNEMRTCGEERGLKGGAKAAAAP